MISFYKWKRQAIFIMLGIIPILLFVFVFFITLKSYNFEGLRFIYIDPVNIAISLGVAIIAIVILLIVGNKLLRHAFTSMLEGKGLLTFILDSTGVIGTFNVKVNAPNMTSVFPQRNVKNIEDIYDTDLLERLMVPQDAAMTKAVSFTKDDRDNIIFGEEVDVIVLPKEKEKYEHLFSFENRPVFIFNKVMNKFLSRDALAKFEKDIEIKHNALNILRKVQETDTSFRNFGRYVGENIKPMKKGLFSSPVVKYIVYAAIIGLIVFIIVLFIPGFLNAGSNLGFPG